jgi:hypothetical protein
MTQTRNEKISYDKQVVEIGSLKPGMIVWLKAVSTMPQVVARVKEHVSLSYPFGYKKTVLELSSGGEEILPSFFKYEAAPCTDEQWESEKIMQSLRRRGRRRKRIDG